MKMFGRQMGKRSVIEAWSDLASDWADRDHVCFCRRMIRAIPSGDGLSDICELICRIAD